MKVLGVIALAAIILAIAGSGSSVPTLSPGGANATYSFPVSDGNNPLSTAPAADLNPAHGKPGHRCDIAVGAPLNSKPGALPKLFNPSRSVNTPVTTSQPTPFVVPGVNPATKLNPPHGQPGHRCDIKVGEPLNSKAVQAPASPVTTPSLNTSTATNPKVNPPHGQPGHRCGIKVGDPL